MEHCSTCGQPLPAEPEEIEHKRLRAWMVENGVVLIRGEFLRLEDGARYLGLATKTLRNAMPATHANPLPTKRFRNRTYLEISEFCRYIAFDTED